MAAEESVLVLDSVAQDLDLVLNVEGVDSTTTLLNYSEHPTLQMGITSSTYQSKIFQNLYKCFFPDTQFVSRQ